MPEVDTLILSYSHLADFPRASDALYMLNKIASLVKPLMRARGWIVRQLTEFYPHQQNLLGLNVNAGQKICLRLRYPSDRTLFLPLEQVVDTMLHELAHNVHGPHDGKFHALWNQLRDEHEALAMKGYTGEGFLSQGHRLGGRRIPMEEARRLARASAEKRRVLGAGSGKRLGGSAARPDRDIRATIVDAVERRNKISRGCANDNQSADEIREIADTATRNGFRTQAEEDAANEAAIAQALWELVQEDEKSRLGDAYVPPTASVAQDDNRASKPASRTSVSSIQNKGEFPSSARKKLEPAGQTHAWTCAVCTLQNQAIYLCCDACGSERQETSNSDLPANNAKRKRTETIDLTKPDLRNAGISRASAQNYSSNRSNPSSGSGSKAYNNSAPQPKNVAPATWTCSFCGRIRERQWWSCDMCGKIKDSSA